MNFQNQFYKRFTSYLIIGTFLIGGLFITAQDLQPNEDLSLGSSVFVFRSGRTAQKKFVSNNKTKRSKMQRTVAVKRIRKQYDNLASVTARRKRVRTVAPEKITTIVA
jgi:hypothetical protein